MCFPSFFLTIAVAKGGSMGPKEGSQLLMFQKDTQIIYSNALDVIFK